MNCIILSSFMMGTMILNIVSFFPLFVSIHYGKFIDATMTGLALACFNLAGTVFTPLHAHTISKFGRKNSMMVGFVFMLISNTMLGIMGFFKSVDWQIFFAISCTTRFIQGYGDSLAQATSMSLVGSQFPDQKNEKIG